LLRLILAFVDVMLHRRGPEDMPSSKFLVWALFAAALAVNVAILLVTGGGVVEVAVSVLVALLDVWFVWALLRTFNRERRFRQTMSALLGVGIILKLVGAPFVPFLPDPIAVSESVTAATPPPITIPQVLVWVLAIWSLDVAAFVFARAIERPYLLCVAVILGYALLILSLEATLLTPVK
jgi:hypothetical protein